MSTDISPSSQARRQWIPIAGIAAVALTIPLGFLTFRRVHRNRALTKAPPRRTANASSAGLPASHASEALPSTVTPQKTSLNIRELVKDIIRPSPTPRVRPPLEAVLSMATAFGLATAAVSATSALVISGGMAYLGVNNVHEFSYRMRAMLATKMPLISSRIQNLHVYSDEDSIPDAVREWTWESARERLQAVYDNEGFLAWSEAALEEMEIEARLERFKRRQLDARLDSA